TFRLQRLGARKCRRLSLTNLILHECRSARAECVTNEIGPAEASPTETARGKVISAESPQVEKIRYGVSRRKRRQSLAYSCRSVFSLGSWLWQRWLMPPRFPAPLGMAKLRKPRTRAPRCRKAQPHWRTFRLTETPSP